MKLTFFFFFFTLLLLTAFSYAFVDSNFFPLKSLYTGIATDKREIVTILYIFFTITLFCWYIFFLNLSRKNKIKYGEFKKLIFGSVIILFISYPSMLSYDIFNYLATAKVIFLYGENPYIIMPIEFISDPNLLFTRAANKIVLYGPSWILLTFIPFIVGAQNILTTVFAFKAFVAGFYLATGWLIWKLSKNIHSLVFFMLNPLVLIETLVGSHNDIVMMFLALVSFYYLKKGKSTLSGLTFAASVLIKYTTAVLLPVFLYSFYLTIQKKQIPFEKMYFYSAILMLVALALSPLREELYPWYVIWVIPFVTLLPKYRFLQTFAIILSFGTLLRYVPFIYTGNYFGITPIIRETLTFFPLMAISLYFLYKKRVTNL